MKCTRMQRLAGAAVWVLLLSAPSFAADGGGWQPPRLDSPEGKIALIDAVRLTLANDPNLLVKRTDVTLKEGVAQELRGQFDWILKGELSYEHREQGLRDSAIEDQKQRRSDLELSRDTICGERARLGNELTQLDAALANGPGNEVLANPRFNADLANIDAQINLCTNPALLPELRAKRDRMLAAEKAFVVNAQKEAAKACRDLTDARARLGDVPEFEEFDRGRFSLRLERLFRGGASFAPYLNANYDSTQFVGKRNGFYEQATDANGNPLVTSQGTAVKRLIDFGGKNIEDLYKAEVGFDVNLPLLRGRGVDEVTAREKSADIDVEASTLAYKHGAAESVLATVRAYWNLAAAQERLSVLDKSTALQARIVAITREQIAGDVLPASELFRAQATEAGRRGQAENARRELVSARLELARAMGVLVESEAGAPYAVDPFPLAPEATAVRALDSASLAATAVTRRLDHRALVALHESGKILARGAELQLRPKLDVSAGLWATALGESSFSNAVDEWRLPSWKLKLDLEKPFGNNQAKGRLGQQQAGVARRQIEAADLDRNIRLRVVLALRSLDEATARLATAQEAVGHFMKSTDAEVERLKAGESSLVDALVTEGQSTSALLDLIEARRTVAEQLARLRFETGTMVTDGADQAEVTPESVATLPSGS